MKYETDRNTGAMSYRFTFLAVAIVASIVLMGCHTTQKSASTASGETSATDESSKDTQKVKGINDWEGEIAGKPAPGSTFTKLQICLQTGSIVTDCGAEFLSPVPGI